jgi:hypothetical protein
VSARQLLTALQARGVRFELAAGQLRCSVPRDILTPGLRAEIAAHRDRFIALLREDAECPAAACTSPAQRRIWFIEQAEPGTPCFNLPLVLKLSGPLCPEALEAALREIARRHEVLRTVYRAVDGEPVPVLLEAAAIPIRIVALPPAERDPDAVAMAVCRAEVDRPFDIASQPPLRAVLLRQDGRQHYLALTRHHIAGDGWSLGLMLRELAALYEDFCSGAPSRLPPLSCQYAELARRRDAAMDADRRHAAAQYWRRKLAGARPSLALPRDPALPSRTAIRGGGLCPAAEETDLIELSLATSLKALCRRMRVTLFHGQLATFFAVLHHHSERTDLLIATDYSQRCDLDSELLIGNFVNRLPLRVDLSSNPSFTELVRQVQMLTLEACAHADLPFEEMVAAAAPRLPGESAALFHVLCGLHASPRHAPYHGLLLHRLSSNDAVDLPPTTTDVALCLYVTDAPDGLVCELRYDATRFTPVVMRQVLADIRTVVECAAARPDLRLDELREALDHAHRTALRHSNRAFHTALARRFSRPLPGHIGGPNQ